MPRASVLVVACIALIISPAASRVLHQSQATAVGQAQASGGSGEVDVPTELVELGHSVPLSLNLFELNVLSGALHLCQFCLTWSLALLDV